MAFQQCSDILRLPNIWLVARRTVWPIQLLFILLQHRHMGTFILKLSYDDEIGKPIERYK